MVMDEYRIVRAKYLKQIKLKAEDLISNNQLNFQSLVNILKTIPNSGMFTTQLCCLDTELSGDTISYIDLLPHLINRGIGSP